MFSGHLEDVNIVRQGTKGTAKAAQRNVEGVVGMGTEIKRIPTEYYSYLLSADFRRTESRLDTITARLGNNVY